jgi:hypothetical protein
MLPKTVILQSYRTERVEPLVSLAMATVRQWAMMRGYAYEFMDDVFFDIVPEDFRAKTDGEIWQMADMARLLHIRRLLGVYERAIWLDADLVVLDADAFRPLVRAPYFFCREYWVNEPVLGNGDDLEIAMQVNNSVCGFVRGVPFLEWYIAETYRATLAAPADTNWNATPLSTRILTKTHSETGFPLYDHCGIMSPALYKALNEPGVGVQTWSAYASAARGIAAINMTLSLSRSKQVSDEALLTTLGTLWTLNASRQGWHAVKTAP